MVQKTVAVIPAYNEEEHIALVIKAAKEYVDEVIVVDDGSKDSTYDAAREADIRLRHIVNMGKGVALRTGIEAALFGRADVIITVDADGQHKAEDIPRLVNKLINERLDLVIGIRKPNQNMPLLLKLGNWKLNWLFKKLFHYRISDTQSGFRAFDTKIYPKIKWSSSGYSVETEMLALAGLHKLRCGVVPIDTIYLNNVKGTTAVDGIKIGLNMLIWKLKWWLLCL